MELSNLTLEDLVTQCPRCQGRGYLPLSPTKIKPSMGLQVANRDSCPDCEAGQIYSPLGKTLRDFVRIAR